MNKKIAILTHFNVCNFGANIQALSTSSYLKSKGFYPIFIDWANYQEKLFTNVPNIQQQEFTEFIKEQLIISPPLFSEEDIYTYLVQNEIFNVLVGSDAVFSLNTWWNRLYINKKGFKYKKDSNDKKFPNPYWLPFLVNDDRFKCVAMSVSSQNTFYQLFSKKICKKIKQCIRRFEFLSVRDEWTANMIKQISGLKAPITPDPVWGFNFNYTLIDDSKKDDFLLQYHIDKPYILIGFQNVFQSKTDKWLKEFVKLAHKNNYICIPLPFAFGYYTSDLYDTQITFPLSPLNWYKLIKYSSGYIGYNMHPIIASLHNNKPCYSVDNYGINILKRINIKESSKIFDILKRIGYKNNRNNIKKFFTSPSSSPEIVFQTIVNYDKAKGSKIIKSQNKAYQAMMESIIQIFSNHEK